MRPFFKLSKKHRIGGLSSGAGNRIGPMTRVDKNDPNYIWYSPVEADSFSGLPPAYIETAEFDCLHDDGILYAQLLREVFLFFYYPADEYISYLMTVDELEFYDEIECDDLFAGNDLRERIMIFQLPDYESESDAGMREDIQAFFQSHSA